MMGGNMAAWRGHAVAHVKAAGRRGQGRRGDIGSPVFETSKTCLKLAVIELFLDCARGESDNNLNSIRIGRGQVGRMTPR